MASTVVLLQHGEKVRGIIDPPLTGKGRRQVLAAARALAAAGPVLLVSSQRARAQESIHPLAVATGLPVVIGERALDSAGAAALVVIATHGGVTADLLRSLDSYAVTTGLLNEGIPNGHLTTLIVDGEEIGVTGVAVSPHTWSTP